VIRPRQRIAFTFPKLKTAAIQVTLKERIDKLSNQGFSVGGVKWTLDEEGLVILRGEVDSERTRKLTALMVRLEPGVRTVQNELTVENGAKTE
jgi:hypothetical protein